jgi:predicted nucleic acid-binding protein
VWEPWSRSVFHAEAAKAPLVINASVVAELSPAFVHDWAKLDAWLPPTLFVREELPFASATLAAKAYEAYKRRGGAKQTLLADFLIGAHATHAGHTLLTRDAPRYRTYFPSLPLLCP